MWGKLLCKLGRHLWRPIKGAKVSLDWRSKWDAHEVTEGRCQRPDCGLEAMIRRDYYW